MRKLFITLAFLLASATELCAQRSKSMTVADTEFFYLYGGVNDDIARCIKETPEGGYIIAGTSSSFGHGDASVYLVKTDSLGNYQWSSSYGETQNDWGYSVEVTADSGFFVAGYSNSFNPPNGYDAYYFKTDKNGNLLWQKIVSGYDWDFIYGSVAMPDGGFILCGETFTNSNGGTDAWLIRLNKNGDTLWTNHYGGLYDETFNSVTLMYGQIYAVGKNQTHALSRDTVADGWIVKVDTNGKFLKETFIVDTCTTCPHAEEILLGITPYTNDLFHFCGQVNQKDSNATVSILGRADTSLFVWWAFIDGATQGPHTEVLNHVTNLDNGNFVATGYALGGLGGTNMYFTGYDPTDGFINGFVRHSGGAADDYGYYSIFTSRKRIIGVGSSQSFCSGLNDYFLVRFDGDTIQNGTLTGHNPKITCFKDTLDLWQVSTNYYNKDLKLNLFPNPATGVTQLQINYPQLKTFTVKVFSILGIEIMDYKFSSNTTNTIDISSFAPGNYFVKIQDENGQNISVIKLVVSN
jgi:hypothetical protein